VAALGSAAVFAAAAVPGLRGVFFPQVSTALLVLGLAPLPFSLAADSLAATLLSEGRTGIYGATLWGRNVATGLVLAASLLAPDRLTWILAGRLVVQAAAAAATAIAAHGWPRWKEVSDFAPGALRYAVPTALSDAVNAVHRRADVFLLSALGRMPEIAPYAIAYAIAEVFWLLTDSLETALFVDITRQDPAGARTSASRALRLYLLLGLAAGVAGLAAGEGLLRLFFHALAPAAAGLLPWLVGAAVAWGLSRPLSSFFASRRRLGTILSCHLAALAINVTLNLLWIPRAGATGAAKACLVSYAADSLLLILAFRLRREDEVTSSRVQRAERLQ
jgi:O-antigen/teichoic acid export membrane protein